MNSEGYKDPTAEHAIQAAGHLRNISGSRYGL